MKIGSHNSWTFRRPDKWWMRLFGFVTRCQSKDISTQLALGAEIFDLRLRLVGDEWRVAHGATTYGLLPYDDLFNLNSQTDGVYCRVLLEYNKEPKDCDNITSHFKGMCKALEIRYPNIRFFGGNCKWKWSKTVHDFGRKPPKFIDAYSSMADKNKVNDLWPWLWAKHHNKAWKEKYAGTGETLLMDFIDI